MKYPAMGKNRQYRVTLPELNGGVNYAVPPHLIADNQLSDVKNMWYKDGRLQTRPGLVFVDGDCGADRGWTYRHSCKISNNILLYDYYNTQDLPFLEGMFLDSDGRFDRSFSGYLLKQQGEALPEIKSALPIEVSADSSEALSVYDVVFLVGFSDNSARIYGCGYNEDTTEYTLKEVEPYVPVVLKGGAPAIGLSTDVGGAIFESRNILTPFFECQYTSDGKGFEYYLPIKGIDQTFVDVYYTDGNGSTHHHRADKRETFANRKRLVEEIKSTDGFRITVDCDEGWVAFYDEDNIGVKLEHAGIANNVKIRASKKHTDKDIVICNMTINTWFGGGSAGLSGGTRIFASGNKEYPNLVVWSALNNPTYFPENNYAYIGAENKPITGFGKQGELLVIFKDGETYCTQYIQGVTPTAEQMKSQQVIDTESAQAVFPMVQLHPEIGCDCPDTIKLCNNRLVWLNSDGKVYGLFTTGQYNERNVRELSYPIRKKLKAHTRKEMQVASAQEYRDNYLLLVGEDIFAMDYSSSGFSYYSSYSSDEKAQKAVTWYIWNVHRDGVGKRKDEDLTPKLMESRGTVFMIEENLNGTIVVSRFEEGADDEHIFKNGLSFFDIVLGRKGVACFFQSKAFDFGYPERAKRINPFYLQVSGESGKTLNLTYLNGNGRCLDVCAPTMTGGSLEVAVPMRITPNAVRVREFGFRVESESYIEVGSLTMNYAMMGTVR